MNLQSPRRSRKALAKQLDEQKAVRSREMGRAAQETRVLKELAAQLKAVEDMARPLQVGALCI